MSHLLLDLLGDRLFWAAIFRAGIVILMLPLFLVGAVRDVVMGDWLGLMKRATAARRR